MFVRLFISQLIITSLCYVCYAQEENDVRLHLPPADSSNLSGFQTAILNLFSRSQSFQLGVLQIYRDGEWGSVCDDSWDSLDSQVVCSQLNLAYSFSYSSLPYLRGLHQESPPHSRIWLDEVRCKGDETSLAQCPALPFGANDCSHEEDVNLMCSSLNLNALTQGVLATLIILILISIMSCAACCCCCCPCCPLAQHLRPHVIRKNKRSMKQEDSPSGQKDSHILEFLPSSSQVESYKHDGWSVENVSDY